MNVSSNWILDEAPVGLWVGRAEDGRTVYVNRAFRAMVEIDDDIGQIDQGLGACDRAGNPYPSDRLPFRRAVASRASVTADDLMIRRRDGSEVYLRATAQPLLDDAGVVTHVVVAFTDITREVRTGVERAEFEARLKLALAHAPVALFVIDLRGIITVSEGAGLEPLGVKSGDLVGKSVFDLYRDHPTIPGFLRRGLAGESLWYTVQVGDAVFDSWITPMFDEAGRIVGLMGVSNDVSEKRRLQARAIQNDRVMAMGMLAASVAHEINSPLTYVLPVLERLEDDVAKHRQKLASLAGTKEYAGLDDDAVRMGEALQFARTGVDRIARITHELRTFSRPDDTGLEPTDVPHVVRSVLTLLEKEIQTRARLRLDLEPTSPVMASEVRLGQVVTNLVMNALQALPEGHPDAEELMLATRNVAERVVLEVADSGPGIPAGERERVFEPFVTSKPIGKGSGLGLFVCRNIVRDLGGDITMDERPGGGARFRVSLPAATSGAAPRATPAPPRVETSPVGARILIVDDDAFVLRGLAGVLGAAGYDVETSSDGRSALARLVAEDTFDLVYCDLMMAGVTGMDFADELERRAPDRLERVVFMTGGAFTERAAAFVAARPDRCIEKPFDPVDETSRRLAAIVSAPITSL